MGCLPRALNHLLREQVGFRCGEAARRQIRHLVLDKLQWLGPAWVQGKPAGSWATLILEQVEDMQDYYARYLPQMYLAALIPLLILAAVFPINWAAALILLVTAPLIPLFMALVGMGAADANRRNFQALARLSGHFLDRLHGMETLRLFHRGAAEVDDIRWASEDFRSRTMEVLRMAFLSSVELDFGHYGTGFTLFAGFLVLILAPEFFQPLRDLGTFYHSKAQAVGAAESLVSFLTAEAEEVGLGTQPFQADAIAIRAEQWVVLSPTGTALTQPLTFTIEPGQRVALVGVSGAGKSSLLNALLGFLPYRGSLCINGQELHSLNTDAWRKHISWLGQNPHLPEETLRSNILLGNPAATDDTLQNAVEQAYVHEFLPLLPQGLDTAVGDGAARLSVGQAQRVAVARALLKPSQLLLLDEPTASLDAHSEQRVMQALENAAHQHTTLLVTHRLDDTRHYDSVWVMEKGQLAQQGDYNTLSQQPGPFADLLAQRHGVY